MGRYIFKIVLTFFLLWLPVARVYAKIVAIYPPNGSVIQDPTVHFIWGNTDTSQEYIYRHDASLQRNFGEVIYRSGLTIEEFTRGLQNYRIWYWRIRYHPKDTFSGTYDYISGPFVFGINKEIPEDILKDFVKEEEIDEEEEIIEEIGQKEEQVYQDRGESVEEEKVDELPFLENESLEREINLIKKHIPILNTNTQTNEFAWNVVGSKEEVLGTQDSSVVCRFKYVRKTKSFEKIFCNTPNLILTEQRIYPFSNEYTVVVSGDVVTKFNIQIDIYDCTFHLLKPSTWFRCEERFVESKTENVTPNMFFNIYKGDSRIPVLSYVQNGNSFSVVAGHVRDSNNIKLVHRYRIVSREVDLYHEETISYPLTFTEYDDYPKELRAFVFPFNSIIGVTQWYGYTEYQSPHTGIDFGAYREDILAVDDGEIVGKGWDSYYGECLSGGNFLKAKQSNGIHTVYFHLEDIYVNTGEYVKKGQIIGKSGNSGAWNCQRLAYHLHFETRKDHLFQSHDNPVKYINVDWNLVPTLGYQTYPGRLTGENPHPGR
jgi:hypothetical protein